MLSVAIKSFSRQSPHRRSAAEADASRLKGWRVEFGEKSVIGNIHESTHFKRLGRLKNLSVQQQTTKSESFHHHQPIHRFIDIITTHSILRAETLELQEIKIYRSYDEKFEVTSVPGTVDHLFSVRHKRMDSADDAETPHHPSFFWKSSSGYEYLKFRIIFIRVSTIRSLPTFKHC